uniref:SHSP domain-containing protein n=1 Tax=Timema cristinae TaxID=61476 RepID=A0A7R9H5P6_TIMCR|nr:unnamed protein product [Timema cristinae]
MFQQSRKLLPVFNSCRRALQVQQPSQRRNLWDLTRNNDMKSLIRDMENQMERLERDLFRLNPFRRVVSPRFIPIQGQQSANNTYRVNLDVQGFKPEEINVSVKDKILTIKAKMERSSEDGSKYFQEVIREFTLPENVEQDTMKSYLTDEGVLTLEAECKPGEKLKELPVSKN